MARKKNCCKRKTTLEILLMITTTILTFTVLAYIIIILLTKDTTCNEAICVRSSAEILKFVDQSANPCENFHEFVCGTFRRQSKILNYSPPYDQLYNKIEKERQLIISDDVIGENDTNSLRMMKRFYQSCLNLTAIDADNNRVFMENIEKLGGWPVLKFDDWKDREFNWINFTSNAKKLGLSERASFIYQSIYKDANTGIYLPRMVISRPIIVFERASYLYLMVEIAVKLGSTKPFAYELARVANFEMNISQLINKNIIYTATKNDLMKTTINELKIKLPQIQWNLLLNEFEQTDEIVVDSYFERYIRELDFLLIQTPKRILANYLIWHVVYESAPFLSKRIRDLYNNFQISLLGKKRESREDFCLATTKQRFPQVADKIYIKKLLTEEVVSNIKEMIRYIKNSVIKFLPQNDWMDEETQREAVSKIERVQAIIPSPLAEVDDNTYELDKFNFSSDNIITMRQEKLLQEIDYYSSKFFNENLTHEYDGGSKLQRTLLDPEVIITKPLNNLIVSATILQDHFYANNRPNYLNYATIGRMIARELINGLVKSARIYMKNGEEFDFYSNISAKAFDGKIQCFKEFQLNGGSVDEIVAEFSAIDVAYSAYKKLISVRGTELKLPGLDAYTPNQLYWIQSSFSFCFQNNEGINGAIQNSRYFATDFQCSIDAKMNPKQKCQVF